MSGFIRRLSWVVLLTLAPAVAWAQASITGVVTDVSGAVLPGVTVEASSPALIEKVRSVVTDGSGQYRIVDLRPGTYSVVLTLPGFSSVRRDGIELTGTFVATVNAELRVGEVSEAITVTGQSPVVDVQSAAQQRVMDKAVLDSAPAGRNWSSFLVIVPGLVTTASPDVGGTNNIRPFGGFAIHGGRVTDTRLLLDGTQMRNLGSSGHQANYTPDMGSTQEIVVDYGAASAEMATGGIQLNVIPREGGNAFSGGFFGTGVTPAFQGNNFSQDLKDRGLTGINRLKLQYDINPATGGPIIRDKLWYFGSVRWQTNQNYVGGIFFNRNAGDVSKWTYDPDLSRQAVALIDNHNANVRMTWQATPKNKLTLFVDNAWRLWTFNVPRTSPEAADTYTFPRNFFVIGGWTSTLSNRLLLDVRYSDHGEVFTDDRTAVGTGMTPVFDQGSGLLYRGRCLQGIIFSGNAGIPCGVQSMPNINDSRVSLSYVTGSHAFKVGMWNFWGNLDYAARGVGDTNVSYRFTNGVPDQIRQFAAPFSQLNHLYDAAVYAEDKWTLKRMTVTAGLRFDYSSTYFPEYSLGPSSNLPNRNQTFPRTDGVSYKDINPRVGAAYDLFGNGKTAVKTSLGRYELGFDASVGNPVINQALQVTRAWTPSFPPGHPNYYVPQCNLGNPLANGDCGTISDLTFGSTRPSQAVDQETLRGWGNRPYNWEFSTSVQHELASRVSVNVGYFRRWFGNFVVTDNRALVPTDFSAFSVTAPVDPRLPGGGGNVIPGFFNLNPDKVGQTSNYRTFASAYGSQIEHWNGMDFTINARPREGIFVQGGVNTGRRTEDVCDIMETYKGKVTTTMQLGPIQSTAMCRMQEPFLTQVKLVGSYLLPKVDVQFAAVLQSLPGPRIAANYVATNAQVQPSLGRPLSGNAPNVTVNIVQPGEMYGERVNQLDLRFQKILRFGKTRTNLDFDLYNVTNANPVLTLNNAYGAWLTPLTVLDARLFRMGVRFEF